MSDSKEKKKLTRREVVLARAASVAKGGGTFVFGSDISEWLNRLSLPAAVGLAVDVKNAGAVLLIDGKSFSVESLAKYAKRKRRGDWPAKRPSKS